VPGGNGYSWGRGIHPDEVRPAKLNLFLEIRGKRADGYHEIDTVMETIAVGDLVTVRSSSELSVASNRSDVPRTKEIPASRSSASRNGHSGARCLRPSS
jgi:4-diphosphocytidyl-2C-methyl-D-erythritol kinase